MAAGSITAQQRCSSSARQQCSGLAISSRVWGERSEKHCERPLKARSRACRGTLGAAGMEACALCDCDQRATVWPDPSDTDGQHVCCRAPTVDASLLLRLAVSEHGFSVVRSLDAVAVCSLQLAACTCEAGDGDAVISNGQRIGRQHRQRLQRCEITLATRAGFSATCDCDLSVGCAFN
jgi:hypothetical protein